MKLSMSIVIWLCIFIGAFSVIPFSWRDTTKFSGVVVYALVLCFVMVASSFISGRLYREMVIVYHRFRGDSARSGPGEIFLDELAKSNFFPEVIVAVGRSGAMLAEEISKAFVGIPLLVLKAEGPEGQNSKRQVGGANPHQSSQSIKIRGWNSAEIHHLSDKKIMLLIPEVRTGGTVRECLAYFASAGVKSKNIAVCALTIRRATQAILERTIRVCVSVNFEEQNAPEESETVVPYGYNGEDEY